MRLPEAIRILREHTMACWWPNGARRGAQGDIYGALDEAQQLIKGIKRRQDIDGDAAFYILDQTNPETQTHDDLQASILCVYECMVNTQPATTPEHVR